MEAPVVTNVTVVAPFTLEVTFKDGKKRVIDMGDEVRGRSGVFKPLKNPDYFAQVFVDPVSRTVAWPNGVDLAPERLYEPDPEKYWGKEVMEESARLAEERKRQKRDARV